MATTSAVTVTAGDTWVLAYAAAGTVTLNVQNQHTGANLLIRVGASTATDDDPNDPAEILHPRDMRAIALASGDKVHMRSASDVAVTAILRV